MTVHWAGRLRSRLVALQKAVHQNGSLHDHVRRNRKRSALPTGSSSNIALTTVQQSLAVIYSQSQQQDKTPRNDHAAVVRCKKLLHAQPSTRAEVS